MPFIMKRFFAIFFLSLVLVSCSLQSGKGVNLQRYDYSKLTGWNNNNIHSGFKAFRDSCSVLSGSKIRSKALFADNMNVWKNKCSQAGKTRNPKQFFENNFTPYLVSNGSNPKGKFTGYFGKEISASLTKSAIYKHPIYRQPDDASLLNLTRKEIENGALNGKNLEIAYAKSAAELFFLHIQGSGTLRLPDGKKIGIGFSAKNNAQYTSIGSGMMKEGLLKHGTADEIQQWLDKHPVSGRTIMNRNDRYVFFALKEGGPVGSLGVELTAQASLAVDNSYIPLGTPIWLQTTLSSTKKYFTRLMNAQDTGSDIKGVIRGDIFFGEGAWASSTASSMNSAGNYFLLIPKEINPDSYF
jgi:membrane-bound lytic murein transglycosylase A